MPCFARIGALEAPSRLTLLHNQEQQSRQRQNRRDSPVKSLDKWHAASSGGFEVLKGHG
jgi:hypothetical protein